MNIIKIYYIHILAVLKYIKYGVNTFTIKHQVNCTVEYCIIILLYLN